MRLRALAIVLVLTAALYLLWSWSLAGNHDATAIVSGMALVPLFIVLLALAMRQAATLVGRVARRPRRHRRRRSSSSATTMVSGGQDDPSPNGAGTPSSSAKPAA